MHPPKIKKQKPPRMPRQKGMSFPYWITRTVCGFFFNLGFKTRIVGIENIPHRGAYLLASNHVSYFDPPLISGTTPTPLYFFARKSLLKNWWFFLLHKGLNVIPVDLDGNNVAAVKIAIRMLKEDKPLVIFPEGTRAVDGQLKRGRSGAGFIACQTQVPVVPVRIFGTYEALDRKTTKPKWGMPLTVVISKPLKPEEYDVNVKSKERYQLAVDKIMEAIAKIEKPASHTKSEVEWNF
jgi:1-acyl-sn-glycerol-3-phosphate acyltransferase